MKKIITVLCALGASHTALSNPQNLMHCQSASIAHDSSCVLDSKVVGQALKFAGETVRTDFDVEYSFDCKGHKMDTIGIQSEAGFMPFAMGAKNRIQNLHGSGELKVVDQNPSQTYRKSVKKGCSLVIDKILVTPHSDAIANWKTEASYLKDAIEAAEDLVDLSSTIEALDSFSKDEFTRLKEMVWDYIDLAMEDLDYDDGAMTFASEEFKFYTIEELKEKGLYREWRSVLLDYPELNSLIKVLNYALQNQNLSSPITINVGDDDLLESSQALARHYRKNLRRKIREGELFLENIQDILIHLKAEEKNSIEALKALIEG